VKRVVAYIAAGVILALWASCSEKIADNPLANKTPRTFLWLYPDSTISIGVSRQHLQWWGEDPDGFVRGYLFAFVPYRTSRLPSPDTLHYTWVTKNDTLMRFPLDTLFRYFTVFVKSVDNTFGGLDSPRNIRLAGPNGAYVDNNGNGTYDGGDWLLPGLPGAVDPIGAFQAFPIRNTPPRIAFLPNPSDPSIGLRQPDVTFTVATFGFKGTDDDGDNTLANYRIALNDTINPANWLTIPLRDTVVTLIVSRDSSNLAPPGNGVLITADVYGGSFLGRHRIGRLPGLRLDATNVFYVQSKDVAGEYSQPIRLPSGTQQWFVKRPRGKLLLVSDYTGNDGDSARARYVNGLAALGGDFTIVDTLNMAFGLNAVSKAAGTISTAVPPYFDPALINTFLLYDYVFWYTDQYPSLGIAQRTLFRYLQNGGKVLFSTTFLDATDPRGALNDFAPIDSISSVDLGPSRPLPPPAVPGDTRIPANFILYADSSVSTNVYPQLAFNSAPSTHIVFMRDVYKRSDARVVYRLQADTRGRYKAIDPTSGSDTTRPKIAVVDGAGTVVFFGLPLHLLNNTVQGNPEGLTAFFRKIFTQHFSPFHKVDRRRF
jgi:hypothetical protein